MAADPLSRRQFLHYAASAIGAGAVGAALTDGMNVWGAGDDEPPNILYVFADQMRFCAMGCAGDPYVKTPNLDKLASQGMLLTNAFSCTPLCSPYRAQILTGRYGQTTGVYTNDVKLPESEITIAKVLRERGYATGYIGKWHLEGARRVPASDPRHLGYVPVGAARQGFDYWAARECSHQYFKTCYFRDSPTPIPINGYEPDTQTGLAIEFMKHNKSRPFLLMLSFGPPHNPYTPPKEYDIYDPAKIPLRPNVPKDKEAVARKDIAKYYGLITSLDANVGRMMQALDQLGIAGNTIVCFTADHGDMLYSQGWRLKQKPWEEAAHIPFILRYPDRIKAGQKKDVLFGSVDVMPTLLGLCGASTPKGVQGVDISRVLLGESAQEPESIFLLNDASGGGGGFVPPWRAVRTKEWLYAWSSDPAVGDWLLYNVKEDPYELNNRIDDPACQSIKTQLRALKDQWRGKAGDRMDFPELLASRKGGIPKDWQETKAKAAAKGRVRSREQMEENDPAETEVPAKTAQTEKPSGIAGIDFQFDRDAGGWKAEGDMARLEVKDGILVADATGRQPCLICSPCAIPGGQYNKVRIKMAVNIPGEARLYWTADGLPRMSDPKSVTVPLQADGQFHDCVFDVSQNPRWGNKTITALRLVLVFQGAKPDVVRIVSILGEK